MSECNQIRGPLGLDYTSISQSDECLHCRGGGGKTSRHRAEEQEEVERATVGKTTLTGQIVTVYCAATVVVVVQD